VKGKGKRIAEDEAEREEAAKRPRQEPVEEILGDF
jgi:hypothetical protein